ncbi:uncharacterized protein LOC115667235 [Syzygium oleosum]|uniref:uncharacterized protein LOC115667235 n=1 Tax=Syzygium oleosum TaxID=219896 RepID=UPI0011D2B4DE|nr:uncharacterized protein LOC115667235 [Syzygium oleosum]
MGNAYRDHHHHLHHRNSLQHKGSFLPMLCSRPSIKDVKLLKWNDDRSASFSDDPMSPKVGCMGQVKRTNRVVGFPTPNKLIAITAKANVNSSLNKYTKLKRLFSSKSLLASATTSSAATPASATAAGSCRGRRQKESNGCAGAKKKCEKTENSISSSVSILDMDPPLPVIKKVSKPATEGGSGDSGGDGSLWKRRLGGVALKSLELQQIHHRRHHMQPVTV